MAPGISGSPTRLTTLPHAFCLCQKNGPDYFGSPTRLIVLPQAFFDTSPICLESAGSVVVGCGLTI